MHPTTNHHLRHFWNSVYPFLYFFEGGGENTITTPFLYDSVATEQAPPQFPSILKQIAMLVWYNADCLVLKIVRRFTTEFAMLTGSASKGLERLKVFPLIATKILKHSGPVASLIAAGLENFFQVIYLFFAHWSTCIWSPEVLSTKRLNYCMDWS